MSQLRGADQLRRRLEAIAFVGQSASPQATSFARRWEDATSAIARRMVPVRTGATRQSIRPGGIRRGKAVVVGKYTVNFIDAGSKAHIEPRQFSKFTPTGRISKRKRGSGKLLKFEEGGQTLFRKKVNKPRIAARPFKKAAARRGLEAVDWKAFIVGIWNRAA